MNNNIKLIRARLARNGFKGVSGELIKETILKYTDGLAEFTDEQKDLVTAELVAALQNDSENNLVTKLSETEALAQIDEPSEVINQEQLDMLPSVEPTSLTTYQEKTEMVQAQAQEMGVVLSDGDVQAISEHISGQSTDADELNQEIRGAISAYIQYHKNQSLNKVTNLIQDVYREQSSANREVSQALASGLQQFSRDMEAQRNQTKSTFRNALKCFAVPGTEAQR